MNGAHIFPAHITGARTLYYKFFFQGRYQYRLIVIEIEREFLPIDGPVLEHVAEYVKLALASNTRGELSEVITLETILKQILSGEIVDRFFIQNKLSEYDWRMNHHYICMKILPDQLDIQNHTLHAISVNIAKRLKGACVFEYENNIAIFVNLDFLGHSGQTAVTNITDYLRDSNFRLGVSNEFTGVGEFRLYYQQAEIALSVGIRNRPYIWINRFWELTELIILESCTSQLPIHMVCAPEILRLMAHDEAHGSDYHQTLRVYLKNHMKHMQTSRELHIHRSTLLYRLDRIKAITGVNIENNGKQWYYQLSFKLLERQIQHDR